MAMVLVPYQAAWKARTVLGDGAVRQYRRWEAGDNGKQEALARKNKTIISLVKRGILR